MARAPQKFCAHGRRYRGKFQIQWLSQEGPLSWCQLLLIAALHILPMAKGFLSAVDTAHCQFSTKSPLPRLGLLSHPLLISCFIFHSSADFFLEMPGSRAAASQ